MKKSILCTLLAVLLLCFLTACVSEAPEPTVGKTTAELIHDETTAEPTEITSNGADESSSEPIEEPTEITSNGTDESSSESIEETTTWQWSTEVNGYRLVELTPTETLLHADAADTPITIPDTEIPWYITEWETCAEITPETVPAEKSDLAVKVPLLYEGTCDDITVKIEGFQEYTRLQDPLQIKVTIRTSRERLFSFMAAKTGQPLPSEQRILTIVEEGTFEDPIGKISSKYYRSLSPYSSEYRENGKTLPSIYNKYTLVDSYTMSSIYVMIYPSGDSIEDKPIDYQFDRYVDGSAVLEYLISIDASAVDMQSEYVLRFAILGVYEDQPGFLLYVMEIPIDLVEITLVPA